MAEGSVHIIGAGGHAKVVIDIFRSSQRMVAALYDDDPNKQDTQVNGIHVAGAMAMARLLPGSAPGHLAIGSNPLRQDLATALALRWCSAVHATAWKSPAAAIADGVMLGAFAVVQADASIGRHSIINTGAIIEHDVHIGAFVHVAPGVKLGGGVSVGDGTLVGIGATVLPNMKIGRWCRIGAGAVIIEDVPDNSTIVGVPGRPL